MATQTESDRKPVQKKKPIFIKIEELSPASVGFNTIVRQVGDIKTIIDRKNLDGTTLKISEAIIADSTGCVVLSLRNDQIGMVKKGDGLILRNAKIDMVNNGYMRVAIDRWGLIEPVDSSRVTDEPNLDNNLSEVEYELVKEANTQNRNRRSRFNRNRGRGRSPRGRRSGPRRGRGRGRGRSPRGRGRGPRGPRRGNRRGGYGYNR